MTQAGCSCPKCSKGRMRTISSRMVSHDSQLRYLECTACGHKDKSVVPAEQVFRRAAVQSR